MNLMELFIKITADTSEVDKSIGDTKKKALSFGDVLKANIAGQAIVDGVKAVAGAVKNIGESAIQSYAEYEQLVGGAKLMFGDAYDFVAEKAKNAYSTVQMSQNDYLRQVNGFATGLKTALGGNEQAAAELADKIINAEADVVAATGNSQDAVQNAFNGIMKSNYTMLDNLQIGITPTKEGFQEVIDKVNEWNAANGKATNYVIDNLADAQSALVDYIEMQGLQGYAANEAADTIQGSLAAVKGAWVNLLVGVSAGSEDIDTLINSFVESVSIAGENLLPRVQTALSGMSQVITSFSSTIVPMFVDTLIDNAPALISSGADLMFALADGVIENIDVLIAAGIDIVVKLAESISDPERSETIGEAAVSIIIALVTGLINATPRLISAAANLVLGIITGITNETDKLVLKGMDIVMRIGEGVKSKLEDAREWGRNLLEGLWNGITDKVEWLKGKVSGVVDIIKGWFTGKEGFDTHSPSKWAGNIGGYIMQGLSIGMENSKGEVMDTVESIISEVKGRFESAVDFFSAGKNIADLQYELWERTDGANASESEKLSVRLLSLGRQQQQQAGIVEAAEAAYKAVAEQYGEVSEESYKYQERLLKEKLALQDLLDKIKEVSSARDEAYNSQAMQTGTVSFADSMIAKATLPVVNAVAQYSRPANNQGETSFNLVLPDGVKLASYLFRPLVQYAAANGTPILNPT